MENDVAGIICICQIMLATSCCSISIKKSGSIMWMMTWQALSVRPYCTRRGGARVGAAQALVDRVHLRGGDGQLPHHRATRMCSQRHRVPFNSTDKG